MSFVYINIMRKCQDRLNSVNYSVNVEARGPSAAYALDISSDTRVESGLCAGSLKMELAADKTRNNAD